MRMAVQTWGQELAFYGRNKPQQAISYTRSLCNVNTFSADLFFEVEAQQASSFSRSLFSFQLRHLFS
jgi:hypothetical protein